LDVAGVKDAVHSRVEACGLIEVLDKVLEHVVEARSVVPNGAALFRGALVLVLSTISCSPVLWVVVISCVVRGASAHLARVASSAIHVLSIVCVSAAAVACRSWFLGRLWFGYVEPLQRFVVLKCLAGVYPAQNVPHFERR